MLIALGRNPRYCSLEPCSIAWIVPLPVRAPLERSQALMKFLPIAEAGKGVLGMSSDVLTADNDGGIDRVAQGCPAMFTNRVAAANMQGTVTTLDGHGWRYRESTRHAPA